MNATLTSPELTRADRCDRCGSQAYVRARLHNGGELLFCAHHGREYTPKLTELKAQILDELVAQRRQRPGVGVDGGLWAAGMVAAGLAARLGAPLLAHGNVLGVIHVGTLTPRRFDEGDVELLRAAAELVAAAGGEITVFGGVDLGDAAAAEDVAAVKAAVDAGAEAAGQEGQG